MTPGTLDTSGRYYVKSRQPTIEYTLYKRINSKSLDRVGEVKIYLYNYQKL
jgi:hypothetical protein